MEPPGNHQHSDKPNSLSRFYSGPLSCVVGQNQEGNRDCWAVKTDAHGGREKGELRDVFSEPIEPSLRPAETESFQRKINGKYSLLVFMLMPGRRYEACAVSSRDSGNHAAPSVRCEKLPTELLI